ncbi:MAG: nuclease [Pelagibacterium sp. SCN 63-23]|nr:MAG: nuclease [Pelagibacterium sp. SCN 63-23]
MLAAMLVAVISTPAFAQSGECRIKGNVSTKGERIYHVPGQKYYDDTRIQSSHGERWFCSEAEARAAGWRRSKV